MEILILSSSKEVIDPYYTSVARSIAHYLARNGNDLIFGAASTSMMGICYDEFKKNDREISAYTTESYINDLENLKDIIEDCDVHDIYIPDRYNYDEICKEIDNVTFYDNYLEVMDLTLTEVEYRSQTVGVYLDVKGIGDVLIPEIKPTKNEGVLLSEEYSGVKYFYQPAITKNIDLELLSPINIITNGSEGDMSLANVGDIKINKEGWL